MAAGTSGLYRLSGDRGSEGRSAGAGFPPEDEEPEMGLQWPGRKRMVLRAADCRGWQAFEEWIKNAKV